MAQINKPTEHFDTKTWSGNNTDPTTISGLNFQPDMVWAKARSGTYGTQDHCLNDAVRGANKVLRVNQTNAEETDTNNLESFTSDGWTMGNDGKINQASTEYVGWSWKAGGTASSNTDGSITSSVSANTTAGFSIVSYTGNATAGATVGHGLGVTPDMFIIKVRSTTNNWAVYHKSMGETKAMYLDGTSPETTDGWLNNTAPTSSVFTLSGGNYGNTNGNTHIAYCFAEKKGYSKFGSYAGNGSSDGTFVYTGFRPAWILVKAYNTSGENWTLYDSKRNGINADTIDTANRSLRPNSNDTEATASGYYMDILSNGFKFRNNSGSINTNGYNYIYMAFAEQPLVGTNNIPATAR